MFPVRCYTCNSHVGHLYKQYTTRVTGDETKKEVMDSLGLNRICCRRMLLTHVHVISDLLRFSNNDVILDDSSTALYRHIGMKRTFSCD